MIIITNLLAGLGDFLTASSLHQFVTEPADSSVSAHIAVSSNMAMLLLQLSARPGLGLSETWYSCIVGIMSLGQLAGAIMVGILSRYMYIKYLMLAALGLTTIGGVLYGIGSYGWMILIGQLHTANQMQLTVCVCRTVSDRAVPGSSHDYLSYLHWRDQ